MAFGSEETTAATVTPKKSKILVVGGTGYIGKHVVFASARLGYPTVVLVRDLAPSDPAKAQLLQSFRDAGVTHLHGDLYDHDSLVRTIRDADVIISTLGAMQIADQTNLIAGIKEAVRPRPDHTGAVEAAKSIFAGKAVIRRAVEAAGIPHTYVVSNYSLRYILKYGGSTSPASYTLPAVGRNLPPAPPVDRVVIIGDGKTKVVFVEEEDIGTFTVLAAADPWTENKAMHIRPAANTMSHDELVSLWEKKTGKKLERVHLPEEAVLKQIHESPIPLNILLSIAHAAYIRGEMTTPLDPASDMEATELFPDY
uniref:NmrA-like domain-containing protein n=1 Tax=Leersia perrieri TaxID=77586 RepID=A0A0D9UVU3_9ORYZ